MITILQIPPPEGPRDRVFEVGKTYKTLSGKDVTIVSSNEREKHTLGYECCLGDDGKWRYDRPEDRGRITGSAFDMSCPDNLVVPP